MGVEVGGGRGKKEGRERRVGCQEVERTGRMDLRILKQLSVDYNSRILCPAKLLQL